MLLGAAVFARLKALCRNVSQDDLRGSSGCYETCPGTYCIAPEMGGTLDWDLPRDTWCNHCRDKLYRPFGRRWNRLNWYVFVMFSKSPKSLESETLNFHFLQNICKNITFCIPIFFRAKTSNHCASGKKFSSKKLIAIKNESNLLWSG